MTIKGADNKYIVDEEKKFLGKPVGDNFIEPIKQIAGYESISVRLMSPINTGAYEDWINSAFYASLCTWDTTPHEPITKMYNLSLCAKEVKLLNILKERPISVALEGVVFNFKVTGIPRTQTHQIVRHRQMSFGQQSFRVSSCYSDPVRIPQDLLEDTSEMDEYLIHKYTETVARCRKTYKELIQKGIPMEQARNIMPMGTCTKISITMRLRDMIAYVKDRTSDIAQDEHTYIVVLMLKELQKKQPKFYKIVKLLAPGCEKTMLEYTKRYADNHDKK